jgi:CubicO group peptidase (beta-lactamase class C family)
MKKAPTFFSCLLFFLFLTNISFAQDQAKVYDKLLNEVFDKDGPGGTAIIVKNGKTIYKKAFGKANLELDIDMNTEHVFRIGSITKQFTACAILKLMEEGKLSLQDDITKYVKDYPTHGHKITIEHLLTHTSGIKSYTGMEKWDEEVRKKDFSPTAMIDFFKDEPMDFDPGEKFAYNNSGYFLLGYIIEKVSGKTYANYIEDTFFKPLGMKNSYYGNTSRLIKNRAAGYQGDRKHPDNADFLSMTQPYAAGSLLSTIEDISKWYHAVNEGKVISSQSLKKAHTPYKLNDGEQTDYGYGWFIGNVQKSPMYQHGGGINGFLTASLFIPKEKVFVAVFSNCTCNGTNQAANKMAAEAIGKPFNWEKIKVSNEELAAYQAVYEYKEEQRVISYHKGQLYSMRSGGQKLEIFPYAKDKFFFKEGMTTLEFNRDANGKIQSVTSHSMGSPNIWKRTDKEMPQLKTIEITDAASLDKYLGKYQLAPEFILTITRKKKELFVQATGQPILKLAPVAKDKFAIIDVDAQILFNMDETHKVVDLTLFQNGEHKAKKIE